MIGGAAMVAVVAGLMAAGGLASALVGPGLHAPTDPVYKCKGNNALTVKVAGPPAAYKPTLVMSVSWSVVNDEDSGFAGYWAMDGYTSHVWVWSLKAGPAGQAYYWMHTYTGTFQVPQGAVSPGETGATPNAVTEPAPGYGSFNGGDWGFISANETFTPGALPVSGNIGVKDYGGTTADLLKGTYGNGQTGPTTPYSWYAAYFAPSDPGSSQLSYGLSGNAWGFDYQLYKGFFTNPHGGSASVNEWCNFGAGAYGDIVVAG